MPGNKFKWNSYNDDNLVAAFDMSTRTSGGLMKNLAKTGAAYDAQIFGAPAYVNPLIRAKKTPCMDFGGVNEYLSLANPISGAANFSIITWVNPDSVNGKMIWGRELAGDNYLWFWPTVVGKLEFNFNTLDFRTPQRYIPSKTYMVISLIRDFSQEIWVDGMPQALRTIVAHAPYPADPNFFIGQFNGGILRMDGRLDNMMFYNIALTPAQVWSIYRSSLPR